MITNPGAKILYQAATGLEKAMADADAVRLIALYAEAVNEVWDPYKISLPNLPYLAWATGVGMWDDDWRETTKRVWTARQWEFKSLRGTAAAARMALDFISRDVTPFGYQVRSFTLPPQKVYSGPSLTREQREAWLVTLPQLRVWRVQERGIALVHKIFHGGRGDLRQRSPHFCFDWGASTPSTAIERLRRRARWVIHGVETDVRVTEFGNYWQLHLTGLARQRVFANMPSRPGRYLIPSDAWTRLVTIMPRAWMPWRSPVRATLEPVAAEPERIVEPGTRGYKVFSGLPMHWHAHFVPTDAWRRIFARYAVNDGSGEVTRRRPVQFMGVGRYGFPKYTAWVEPSLRNIRPRLAAGDGIMIPKGKFWLPHDGKPLQRARTAISAAKKLADRVLIQLKANQRFVAGRPFIAGVDSLRIGHS